MLYKCSYCDPTFTKEMKQAGLKPIKTIDSTTSDIIKDENGRYYHHGCFKKHLKENKKMTDDEIEVKFDHLIQSTHTEVKELEEKDNFFKWIMEFYDGSLPSYFLKKLQTIREGTYTGLNEPIDYKTLLDIYSYMDNYLRKIAAKKHFNSITGRMNYDLAVVVGNYGDYKRFKERQMLNKSDNNEVDKQTKVTDKVNNSHIKQNHDDEFDITDIIDDLLL